MAHQNLTSSLSPGLQKNLAMQIKSEFRKENLAEILNNIYIYFINLALKVENNIDEPKKLILNDLPAKYGISDKVLNILLNYPTKSEDTLFFNGVEIFRKYAGEVVRVPHFQGYESGKRWWRQKEELQRKLQQQQKIETT